MKLGDVTRMVCDDNVYLFEVKTRPAYFVVDRYEYSPNEGKEIAQFPTKAEAVSWAKEYFGEDFEIVEHEGFYKEYIGMECLPL